MHESTIERLYLTKTNLQFAGINEIIEGIEKNSHLKYLSLQDNLFISSNYAILEHFITVNSQLKVLNL